MRDTDYATEQVTASVRFDAENEGRIERIFVKETQQEEIRFSWWKGGNIVPRPLDLSEADLLELMREAMVAGVFTPQFRAELRRLLPEK